MSPLTGQVVEITPMRAAIARRMAESQSTVPHFYVSTEISTAAVEAHVEDLSERRGERISVTAALVRACAVALRENRMFNAVWGDDGLLVADDVNIAVAVALDGGLVAPALLGCQALDLPGTAAGVSDLVVRARGRKLRAPEMTDGTFTLSNLGMFDVSSFIALVTPPQVAALAVGRSARRAVVAEDGSLTSDLVVTATLSADHRAVDGADAARFLGSLKNALEHPELLSLDPVEAPS